MEQKQGKKNFYTEHYDQTTENILKKNFIHTEREYDFVFNTINLFNLKKTLVDKNRKELYQHLNDCLSHLNQLKTTYENNIHQNNKIVNFLKKDVICTKEDYDFVVQTIMLLQLKQRENINNSEDNTEEQLLYLYQLKNTYEKK